MLAGAWALLVRGPGPEDLGRGLAGSGGTGGSYGASLSLAWPWEEQSCQVGVGLQPAQTPSKSSAGSCWSRAMVFDTDSLKVDRGALWRREGRALTCQAGVCPPKPASLAGPEEAALFPGFQGLLSRTPCGLTWSTCLGQRSQAGCPNWRIAPVEQRVKQGLRPRQC